MNTYCICGTGGIKQRIRDWRYSCLPLSGSTFTASQFEAIQQGVTYFFYFNVNAVVLKMHLVEGQHWTYISLDHLTALSSDPGDKAEYVHLPLSHHHVQHGIYDNECTCSSHSRARTDKEVERNETYCAVYEVCRQTRTHRDTVNHKVSVNRHTLYLQWTTMGPAYWGLQFLTFFRNLSMPMGVKGTPKSGQLVKWNCVTSLCGFFPDTSPTWDTSKPSPFKLYSLITSIRNLPQGAF